MCNVELQSWKELKQYIDIHCNDQDLAWQESLHQFYCGRVSTIPIHQGVYKGNTDEDIQAEKAVCDLKSTYLTGWNQYCFSMSGIRTTGDKIAAACGPASNLFVLDIDDYEAFTHFCKKYGISTEFKTMMVETRPGRFHALFQHPRDGRKYISRTKGKSGSGADLRAENSFILLPGSLHPISKKPYRILDPVLERAPAPEWLLNCSIYGWAYPHGPDSSGNIFQVPGQLVPSSMPATANLPDEIQRMIDTTFPVGQRSEPVISIVNSALANGWSPEQIMTLLEVAPVGEVARQKGVDWVNRTIASALRFQATNPPLAPQKKVKVDMSKELYQTMLEYEYHLHKETQRYLAKMNSNDGRAIFYDISGDAFAGKILERQEQKTVTSGSDQDFKKAKRKLMAYVTENAHPIKSLGRFGADGQSLLLNIAKSSGECIAISQEGYELRQRPQSFLQDFDEALTPIEAISMGCSGTTATEELLDLLEVMADDRHFLKVLVLSYLFPDLESPILLLVGDNGSGKTTLAGILKAIFDPLPMQMSGGIYLPEEVSDLALELSQQGVLLIDNFTALNKKTQNLLCQAFSFGYFSTKKLYSNGQMIKYPLSCNILMTSLEIPGDLRDDLASRIAVYPVPVRHSFSAKTEIWEKANAIMPQVRGELCALASQVMGRINTYNALGLNRWSDFDKLGQAYFDAIGDADPKGAYETVLRHQLKKNAKAISKKDAAISTFIELIENLGVVVFTMTELHKALFKRCHGSIPEDAAALGKHMRRHLDKITAAGIALIQGGKKEGRIYLAGTEETLKTLDGEYAVDLLRASPAFIANIHGVASDQLTMLLDAFFYPCGKPEADEDVVAESDTENTAADAAVDGSPAPDADVESADPIPEEAAGAIDNGDAAACTVD